MKRYTLMQADYRETLAAVNGTADLVLTSPPYADARTYNMNCNWTDADYAALGDAVFAALKPGGHALINVDAPVRDWTGDGRGTERGLHPWRLMLDWHDRIGFRVPDRLAFGKEGIPGDFWGFRNDWEPLLWFQKPGDGYRPDHAEISEYVGSWKTHTKGSRGRRARGTTGATEGSNSIRQGTTRRKGTYWNYGNCGNGSTGAPDIEAENHPARWPYKLAEDIVRCFCPPDGLAVDPFVGAGTSMIAALEHGRRFHGGDLGARVVDPSKPHLDAVPWITVAERVWIQRTRQQRLFGT